MKIDPMPGSCRLREHDQKGSGDLGPAQRSCPRPPGAGSTVERSPWPGVGALGLPAFLSPAPPRGDPAGEPLPSSIDTTVL